mmetsp:Transcript_17662/g.20364  ORF Transcript_17662/g.20364 Transcript_17662/m.20364 type:complete len:264 (+) Transcript_17662:109-900(+)
MADEGDLRLTEEAVREEIDNYAQQHRNDFGSQAKNNDGRSRIPMKKLMKLFQIKKKSSMERQNLFREIVNEICELEMMEEIGKVLILKETTVGHVDLGYGDAAPTIQSSAASAKEIQQQRQSRFPPPTRTESGHLSVATTEGIGVVEKDPTTKGERKGYKRRGSVTRYSIVAQDAVVDEYKKHEDIINQFRGDSKQIDKGMRRLSISQQQQQQNQNLDDTDHGSAKSGKSGTSKHSNNKSAEVDEEGNVVKRFFRRGRFSLAF